MTGDVSHEQGDPSSARGGVVVQVAADVLRHRLVMSYEGLAEGATSDAVINRVLAAVPAPLVESRR